MKVFVVGCGTMGSGITQCFAQSGFSVVMYDTKDEYVERGYNLINKSLTKLVEKGKMDEDKKNSILNNITKSVNIEDAKDADLVVEAVFENIEVKKDIFSRLDVICKEDTVLATNTSSLSITDIAASTKRSEKVIGMHFFNPAPVMKLIEIIRGITTSDETFEKIKDISIKIGKDPVEVKESAGFVVNRLLIPMINEAVALLAEGVATAEDIDKAMKLGANHPMGPLELADFIGNDVNLAIMETIYNETGDSKYRPHPLLRKMVRAGYLGRKTGRGFYTYK
jgi:3-hydroxybutyryl-CoA dehydrogenase